MSFCQIEGCEAKHYSRGYCRPHYYRWSKWGDPLITGKSGQPRRYHTEEERQTARKATQQRHYADGGGKKRQSAYYKENKEAHYIRTQSWKEAHREAVRASGRSYYAAHKEESRQYRTEYLQRPDVKIRRRNTEHQRRETIRGTMQDLDSTIEYSQIILNDPCAYCGGSVNHIDHIDPLSTGSTHTWGNLTPACSTCNRSKWATPMLLWMAR
jgi:5-methylcytosine-specific restriction endonuclease McrA